MNPLLSAISRFGRRSQFSGGKTRTNNRTALRTRLCLEALEDRLVLSPTISIANASMNEIGNVSPFVVSGSGGLNQPKDLVLGPDGNVYVASAGTNSVIRYTPSGQLIGTFVAAGSGGLSNPRAVAFEPDGNLYVSSVTNNNILEYNGSTGAFVSTFVPAGSGGLNYPAGMVFGQDGNLYVSSTGTESVDRFEGPLGSAPGSPLPAAGQSGATFVASGSGGLAGPGELTFGPNGNLFVSNASPLSGVTNNNYGVLEFDATTGNFITTYVAQGAGGLDIPRGLAFDQGGRLYVADFGTNAIHRYDSQGNYLDDPVSSSASSLQVPIGMTFDAQGDLLISSRDGNAVDEYNAGVVVTLSSASSTPVSVNYATADGTAIAGTNYTATSGTLTFAPGVTTQTIRVPLLGSGSQTTPLTFTVNLSSPQLATLSQSQATGTIEPSDQAAKFYVLNNPGPLNGGNHATFKYQPSGTEQAPFFLSLNDLDPYGIAANPTGTEEWVVDRNGNIYVYSSGGTLLGSWTPGGLPAGVSLEGIATDGTNISLLDATTNKVFEYAGAASRLSGTQNATSSFKLNRRDNGPNNLVTDGNSIWVVDGNNLKVFKYTVAGRLLGSWSIDPAEIDPTGITVNPNNPSDIWIVDAYTHAVYDYTNAASRTSGSQNASATFALAAGNTNPLGIADPPSADMLLTPAASPLARNQPSVPAVFPPVANRDAAFALLAGESLQKPGEPAADLSENLYPVSDLLWTTAGAFGESNPLDPLTILTPSGSPSVRSDGSAMGLRSGTSTGEDNGAFAAATDCFFAGLMNDAAVEE
jgi:DNA-binding beta-propeller fold protein YncE